MMHPPRTLAAFYDFKACPVTFDFFTFLVGAEMERARLGLDRIHVVFVPAGDTAYMEGFAFDEAQMDWRLHNILIPGCALMPSCREITRLADREPVPELISGADGVFPNGYTEAAPVDYYQRSELVVAAVKGEEIPPLVVPAQALRYIGSWLDAHAGGRKVVTITLRQSAHSRMRNSNLAAWCDFARGLDQAEFLPVIVPDTDAALGPPAPELDGLVVFTDVANNLLLRAALYELSFLNMGLASGPGELQLYNPKVRSLIFLRVDENSMDNSTEALEGVLGIPIGGQFPFAKPYQKTVWRRDDPEAIREEFGRFLDFDAGRLAPNDYLPAPPVALADIAARLENGGRPLPAQEIYEALLADDPSDAALNLRIAVQDVSRGRYDAAAARLAPLEDALREDPEFHETAGDAQEGLGNLAAAAQCYQKAVDHAPAGAAAAVRRRVKLGWCLAGLDRLDDAVANGNAYLEEDPCNVVILRHLGELLDGRAGAPAADGYFRREQAVYEQRLRDGQDRADDRLRLGALEVRHGNFARAAELLGGIVADDENRWEAQEHLGDALRGLGRADAALAHYEAAVELTWRRRAISLFKLATLQVEIGDLEGAERSSRDCRRLAPGHAGNLELLCGILYRLGRTKESMDLLVELRQAELSAR